MTDPVHVVGDVAEQSAGGDDFVGPAGKEGFDHVAAARQQTMRVTTLRHALARNVIGGKGVALENRDRLEVIGQRAGGEKGRPCWRR